ncbi:MAG: Rieske 2Fe-2S domain-containing protein [Bacteroidota bacterium]
MEGTVDCYSLREERAEVLLLNVDDRTYAINKVCPHQDFSALYEGSLKEPRLTWPMHG